MVKFVLSVLEGGHRILLFQDFMQEILLILFMSVLDLIMENWSNIKNILIGAGIIEYTEKKDGRFVSIKNKDKFEKLRNSLNSKILKKYSHKEKEKCA